MTHSNRPELITHHRNYEVKITRTETDGSAPIVARMEMPKSTLGSDGSTAYHRRVREAVLTKAKSYLEFLCQKDLMPRQIIQYFRLAIPELMNETNTKVFFDQIYQESKQRIENNESHVARGKNISRVIFNHFEEGPKRGR